MISNHIGRIILDTLECWRWEMPAGTFFFVRSSYYLCWPDMIQDRMIVLTLEQDKIISHLPGLWGMSENPKNFV